MYCDWCIKKVDKRINGLLICEGCDKRTQGGSVPLVVGMSYFKHVKGGIS